MGKSAPAPGDYEGAAQKASNSTRPDVNNPFSSTQWSVGPDGKPTVTQGLSSQVQGAFDSMKPFDLGAFGPAQNGSQAREETINSAWQAARSRLDPMFAQRNEANDVKLANQGLAPTSAAARNARRDAAFAQNDAYNQAMAGAVNQGNQAADSVFRNNMMSRQQDIANALRTRGLPLEDMKMLQGFINPLNYGQGADFLGALSAGDQARMQQWQQTNAANADFAGGLLGGLGSLAGGLFGFGG